MTRSAAALRAKIDTDEFLVFSASTRAGSLNGRLAQLAERFDANVVAFMDLVEASDGPLRASESGFTN